MEIEVINWEKYNPRKDYRLHWFRTDSELFDSPEMAHMTGEEISVFIFILCVTCKMQGRPWKFDKNLIISRSRCSRKTVLSAIEKLEQLHIVRFTGSFCPKPVIHNSTEQNITEQNITEQNSTYAYDFDTVYQIYPRKEGKTAGKKIFDREIKTDIDFEILKKAIEKYRDHCKQNVESRFIKHFGTFMNNWRDWTSDDAGISEGVSPQTSGQKKQDRINDQLKRIKDGTF